MHDHFGLCNTFVQILEKAGFLGSTQEEWVQDRNFLPSWNFKDLHSFAVKANEKPFLRDHLKKNWNAARQSRDDSSIDEESPNRELDDAIDEFELCFWNRRVAEDDFKHGRELTRFAPEICWDVRC